MYLSPRKVKASIMILFHRMGIPGRALWVNFCKKCGDCGECGKNKYFTAFLTKTYRINFCGKLM